MKNDCFGINTLFLFWQLYFSVVIKQQTTVTDKVKHRLEQLDDFEEVSNPRFKTHQKQELEPSYSVQMFLIILQINLNCFFFFKSNIPSWC